MNTSSMINRGLLTVYGPSFAFVVASGLISYIISKRILNSENTGSIVSITILISIILISWIWWSYKIVKWKFWAFSQVNIEDSYQLYSDAIAAGLIWPTESIFNKTEIWTKKDIQKWSKIDPEIRMIFELEYKGIKRITNDSNGHNNAI